MLPLLLLVLISWKCLPRTTAEITPVWVQRKCSQRCGRRRSRKSTMCQLGTGQEICTRFVKRRQRQGYTCGPCADEDEPPRMTCPPVGETKVWEDLAELTNVFLPLHHGMTNQLCGLWLLSANGVQVPIARTYQGHEWEAYAGHYSGLRIDCRTTAGCRTLLPAVSDELRLESYQYILRSHSRLLLGGKRDEDARFLEQATFGPRLADLEEDDGLLSSLSSYADWIEQQATLPYSSHRRTYRHYMNQGFRLPSSQGIVTHACAQGTRYRSYAFSDKDARRPIEITSLPGRKIFAMDGQVRTFIEADQLTCGDPVHNVTFEDGIHLECYKPQNSIGSWFLMHHPDRGCDHVYADGVRIGMPRVQFDDLTPPTHPMVTLDGRAIEVDGSAFPDGQAQELFVTVDLDEHECTHVPALTGFPEYTVVGVYNGTYWLHDPRFQIQENTIQNPRLDSLSPLVNATQDELFHVLCSRAPMNFLNEDYCQLSTEVVDSACAPMVTSAGSSFRLNTDTFERLYDAGPRYVYPIVGLRQDHQAPYDPPCTPGAKSRWIPVEDCSLEVELDPITRETLSELLLATDGSNPHVRDLTFPAVGYACAAENAAEYNMKVLVDGGQCWENVHQSHNQVYDFTLWVQQHPGGSAAITQFAQVSENFTLNFPDWHEMTRWYEKLEAHLIEVGRLGDEISMAEVMRSTDLEQVFVDLLVSDQVVGAVVVCGSPDEVANEPQLYGTLRRGAFDSVTLYNNTAQSYEWQMQRESILVHHALYAPDQLRQRVAWILSQILAISYEAFTEMHQTENFVVYYDIFVRNALGNYRNVLREVSYSTMMATMLTFLGSQSTSYIWQRFQRVEYADENFAREIMQLFSIGLYQLNMDGTRQVSNDGHALVTYTNDDVAEYARLWTGFEIAEERGNIEQRFPRTNQIDPMSINHLTRDVLPKMGLDRKYVGDGMPLCRDLPDKHFLRKGATYRLLGSFPSPNLLRQDSSWATNADIRRLILSKESALYAKICNKPDANTTCTFRPKVVLDENLECTGAECKIESPRVLEVESGLYYEYTRIPCAEQGFFEYPRLTRTYGNDYACADPQLNAGALVCCSGSSTAGSWGSEEFDGELMSLQTAEARCSEKNMNLCSIPWGTCSVCGNDEPHWTSQSCNILAKINLEGRVSIVHSSDDNVVNGNDINPNVRADTKVYFRVDWNGPIEELLADYAAKCEEIGCNRDSFDNLCLCPTSVTNEVAFMFTPSREEIMSTLKIGAFPPDLIERATLSRRLSTREVRVYTNGRSILSADTTFEIVDDYGIVRYLKNELSVVTVGTGAPLDLSFRNPPHIVSLTFSERRDAQYETEAGLDHYFYHKNTGPFLAVRFSQRFGLSNPSPRLITVASGAFQQGEYVDEGTGKALGSGQYGDLLALVSAILLDRESREVVLDADPAHGSVLEPYLKIIRTMRSLNFEVDKDKRFLEFQNTLQDEIGQQAHKIPTVFSFFLPEHSPAGAVGDATLVCPECQVATGPKSIAMMNGLYSLIKFGFDAAYGGFGFGRGGGHGARRVGESAYATGVNTYVPDQFARTHEIVDELATLLTSGRLDSTKRTRLVEIYDSVMNETLSTSQSVIFLQQLIVSTPEFHTNGINRNTGSVLPLTPPTQPTGSPYKAVINIFLPGGWDSFNALVPHTCSGTNEAGATILEQYKAERGELAFTDSERTLIIDAENQPCSQFALHDELTVVKELYDDGDLVFFANTGVIDESGVGKADYQRRTNVQLFAHNAMQKESQTIDPDNGAPGTGVLGRLASVLQSKGYPTSSITIDDSSVCVSPDPGSEPAPVIVSRHGMTPFDLRNNYLETLTTRDYVEHLNAETLKASSLFGQTWSNQFITGIRQAEDLATILDSTSLGSHWPNNLPQYGQRLGMISRLIQGRARRGADRDIFFASVGRWDDHFHLKINLREGLRELNEGLEWLVEELKVQGVWGDVSIVITSEFARTLSSNSNQGSDHAWGGHYLMIGGAVKGGRIVGEYPSDITSSGELNIGRGRLIPTMSWDAVWNSVAQWMGADTSEELDTCLPNRHGSTGEGFADLMNGDDLFETSS